MISSTFWLREYTFENNTVELVVHCATGDMVAYVMTKALAVDSHDKHARNISGFGDVLGWFSSLYYATSIYARGRNPASKFKESKKINPFFYH